jgi:SLT domain-containing protein
MTQTKTPTHTLWHAKDPAAVPPAVQQALREALQREGVAASHYDDLLWILAQESGGRVGVCNGTSTARGLFQLLHMHYGLNPNGEQSFGNAVEECQGGIRYVMQRYRSAEAAKRFWVQHRWY